MYKVENYHFEYGSASKSVEDLSAADNAWRESVPAVKVTGDIDLTVSKTFDCGQCFRFDPVKGGPHFIEFSGIAHGKFVSFAQNKECTELYVYNCTVDDFNDFWSDYLSFEVDYAHIRATIKNALTISQDPDMVLRIAADFGRGIRILKQDKWEALCSFIISQNNNIPRIKRIISQLSELYGEKIVCANGEVMYSFPTAARIFEAGEDSIRDLKVGFRAPYIIDAAAKFSRGEIDFDVVTSGSLDAAIEELRKVKGVGLKVASCAALFGFGRMDAFPVDVWMKRSIERHFPLGIDPAVFGDYAGIAQQFLFYYERYTA